MLKTSSTLTSIWQCKISLIYLSICIFTILYCCLKLLLCYMYILCHIRRVIKNKNGIKEKIVVDLTPCCGFHRLTLITLKSYAWVRYLDYVSSLFVITASKNTVKKRMEQASKFNKSQHLLAKTSNMSWIQITRAYLNNKFCIK